MHDHDGEPVAGAVPAFDMTLTTEYEDGTFVLKVGAPGIEAVIKIEEEGLSFIDFVLTALPQVAAQQIEALYEQIEADALGQEEAPSE